jgi:hypothetical protein
MPEMYGRQEIQESNSPGMVNNARVISYNEGYSLA